MFAVRRVCYHGRHHLLGYLLSPSDPAGRDETLVTLERDSSLAVTDNSLQSTFQSAKFSKSRTNKSSHCMSSSVDVNKFSPYIHFFIPTKEIPETF